MGSLKLKPAVVLLIAVAVILTVAVVCVTVFKDYKIEMSESEIELMAGDTHELSCTIKGKEGKQASVAWSSTDNSVAEVNDEGVVSAKKEGECDVEAVADNGNTAVCHVRVNGQGGQEGQAEWPENGENGAGPDGEGIPEDGGSDPGNTADGGTAGENGENADGGAPAESGENGGSEAADAGGDADAGGADAGGAADQYAEAAANGAALMDPAEGVNNPVINVAFSGDSAASSLKQSQYVWRYTLKYCSYFNYLEKLLNRSASDGYTTPLTDYPEYNSAGSALQTIRDAAQLASQVSGGEKVVAMGSQALDAWHAMSSLSDTVQGDRNQLPARQQNLIDQINSAYSLYTAE